MTKDVEERLSDIVRRKVAADAAEREAAEAKKRKAAEELAMQNALAAKWRQCVSRLNEVINEIVENTQNAGIDLQMEKDASPAAPMTEGLQVLLIVDGKNSKKELLLEVNSSGGVRVRTVGTQLKTREEHVDTIDKPMLMGIVLDFLDGAMPAAASERIAETAVSLSKPSQVFQREVAPADGDYLQNLLRERHAKIAATAVDMVL